MFSKIPDAQIQQERSTEAGTNMSQNPGPTVNAVLETLNEIGKSRGRTKDYLANEIAVLTGKEPRPAGITNWCNGKSTSPSNLPQLALRALGLQQYGFGVDLWDMTPGDASQALRMSLQNGIMGLLADKKPVPPDQAKIAYHTASQLPCLGIVLQDETKANKNSLLSAPTNLMTIQGEEKVFATVSHGLMHELHIRVILEDILDGKPVYYQINDPLGFADTISPNAKYDQGLLKMSYEDEADCRQVSRIWTFVRGTPFPDPWLPGDAPAKKRGDAGVEIESSKIEDMLSHYRNSDPGHYAMSLTQVNYVPGDF